MYGVHTLILKHGLNFEQAATILKSDLDSFMDKIRRLKKNESYIFNLNPHPLIRKLDIAVTKAYNASFPVFLRLQVAPLDIIEQRKTEAIFCLNGLNNIAFYNGLDNLLIELFGGYSFIDKDCKKWDVNYIEYSANLYSENVNLVLEMLKKNAKDVNAKFFNDGGYTLSISKKAKHKRNSSTTAYNKAIAVQSLHEKEYESLRQEVDGYIRFERQLGRAYLWNQIAKKDENRDNLDGYFNYKIAKHVLASSYSKIFCIGDFFSLKVMARYIKDKKLEKYAKSATQSRLIRCTKNNSKRGKGLSTATNNARIRAFEKECVSPVAIPRRSNIDYLPNPIPNDWLPKSIGIKKIEHDILNIVQNSPNTWIQ